jgi:FtsZ-binding cell division protein ZapB
MASKIKFDYMEKNFKAAMDTINDLLKENYELKEQINMLISGQNERANDTRRAMDF